MVVQWTGKFARGGHCGLWRALADPPTNNLERGTEKSSKGFSWLRKEDRTSLPGIRMTSTTHVPFPHNLHTQSQSSHSLSEPDLPGRRKARGQWGDA